MEGWEALAQALSGSPAVEELVVARVACDEQVAAWMSLRGPGFAVTCRRIGEETACRDVVPREGYLVDCARWAAARPIAPPPEAAALIEGWPSFEDVAVSPISGRDDLPAALSIVAAGGPARLALRTDAWRVSEPLEAWRRFHFDRGASFDASTVAGDGAWGLVTSSYGGGSGMGERPFHLTIVRPEGDRLVTVARREIGSRSWAGKTNVRLSGDVLRVVPDGAGRLEMTLAARPTKDPTGARWVDGPSARCTRAQVGLWEVRGDGFVRSPLPSPLVGIDALDEGDLVITEVGPRWMEIESRGDAWVDLAGLRIAREGARPWAATLGPLLVAPGGRAVLGMGTLAGWEEEGVVPDAFVEGAYGLQGDWTLSSAVALLDRASIPALTSSRDPERPAVWCEGPATPGQPNEGCP